jgi:hypothetical protein
MRRSSLTLGCLVMALACSASLAAAQAPTRDSVTERANAVSGGPTGVVSKKKKCKKALWRCAPRRYNLFVSGVVKWATGSESFRAEVHLVRRRAGPGDVIYTTEAGLVAVSASYTREFSDDLRDCASDVRVDVVEQVIFVGPSGLFDPTNFLVSFKLIGPDKNTYGLIAGSPQPDPSTLTPAVATVRCLADGREITESYYFFGSAKLNTKHRGKVGDRFLVGGAINGGDYLKWVLTTRDECGEVCSNLVP